MRFIIQFKFRENNQILLKYVTINLSVNASKVVIEYSFRPNYIS